MKYETILFLIKQIINDKTLDLILVVMISIEYKVNYTYNDLWHRNRTLY